MRQPAGPGGKWIIATFGPAFANYSTPLRTLLAWQIEGYYRDAIDLAVVVLRGLADFLKRRVPQPSTGMLPGRPSMPINTVWDKMTNAIKTAVNGIIGFINRMISAVVTGINAVINALNGLSFDLPVVFGGGHIWV